MAAEAEDLEIEFGSLSLAEFANCEEKKQQFTDNSNCLVGECRSSC